MQSKHQGIIGLWAVAECGLGGILHAFKLPFTGILVGGISAMCLYFIAQYNQNKKHAIMEATSIVLMIKLLASPHSPWQAYVAVIFQAAMALVFLSGNKTNPLHVLAFTLITQVESALQKIVIMVLLFGSTFFNALDKSATQLLQLINVSYSHSVVITVFAVYVSLHIITGITLGIWLPKLENEVKKLNPIIAEQSLSSNVLNNKSTYSFWITTLIGLSLPLLLAFVLNDASLLLIIVRVLLISVLFIFIITPLIKYWLKRSLFTSKRSKDVYIILDELPALIAHYKSYIQWALSNYKGIHKIKFVLIALLYASQQTDTNTQIK